MEHTIIINQYNSLVLVDGKMPHARLEWHADGHNFYLRGKFSGNRYELAANIVLSWCIERHINTSAIRRVVA